MSALVISQIILALGGAHHSPGCSSTTCDARQATKWAIRHRPKIPAQTGPTYRGVATYYSDGPCDSGSGGGSITASGDHVYFGEVANSVLRLGTKIWVSPAIFGRHVFAVLDRFGSRQDVGRLDVYLPCSMGAGWNNPVETFRAIAG